MRAVIILALSTVLASWAYAAKPENLPGYALKTKIEFKTATKTQKLATEIVIDKASTSWVEIGKIDSGLYILGRVAKSSGPNVAVEYKVVDRSGGKEVLISQPKLMARNGETTKITVNGKAQKFHLSSNASSIFYINE